MSDVLPYDEREAVTLLAFDVLLDDNKKLKPLTFLTDERGNIRRREYITTPKSNEELYWPELARIYEDNRKSKNPSSDEMMLFYFCRQLSHDTPECFAEKGRFMRQVLLHAMSVQQPRELSSEGRVLYNHIPLTKPQQSMPQPENPSPSSGSRIVPAIIPRRGDYELKVARIKKGEVITLLPKEFFRYVLIDRDRDIFQVHHEQGDIMRAFSIKGGWEEHHLGSNVFQNANVNKLSMRLREILCRLSTLGPDFWSRTRFSSAEADGVILDMDRDVSDIVEKYKKDKHIPQASAQETPGGGWLDQLLSTVRIGRNRSTGATR